jgi:hypothetical protein
MRPTHRVAPWLALIVAARLSPAQNPPALAAPGTSIATRTQGMEKRDGFVPVYRDTTQGKIYLELPRDSVRMLVFFTLATGLGSNPVGLDRGEDGPSYVTRFDRDGARVLVVFENWRFRSSSANAAHRRSVAESFPPSTVAALPLLASEGGRLLVDATDFVVHDWMGVPFALRNADQGTYALARDRSGVNWEFTRAFPQNTELDARLTFATTGRPGGIVAVMAPDGQAFTLREHISLLPLPGAGYRPRALDPRVGYFAVEFNDYAQPIQADLTRRWIVRHRLERVNPDDPRSPIKTPIVYYLDRGIPEPIRSAMMQGAKWWEQAFADAGLGGGFVVRDLPEGVDPMDARYNVVQWVNRNERGWSVGGSLGDPRTGEILKAMARLDSHRARTDYNLYAGLMGAAPAAADTAFVLARVRQVTAHEIGHTLGLAHNYIASTYDRASVMDYPPPRLRLDAHGDIDLSAAYAVGPGPYDVWAIRWGYGVFPPATEADSLRAIVAEGLRRGYLFLSDADARPDFASDPRTNLWDDAATPLAFLRYQMQVRRAALARFGERNIRPGEPVALLQERFAPVYFLHRFALASLAKAIGGMEYANAVVGDGQQETRPVAASAQRAALSALLGALEPAELAVPDTVLTLLGPRPYGYRSSVELVRSRARPAFDALGAARTLAQMIVDAVLQRDRAARLVAFATRESRPLTLAAVIDSLVARTWGPDVPGPGAAKLNALRRVAGRAVADRLLALAADTEAAPEVRAMIDLKIVELGTLARQRARSGSEESRAHWSAITADFTRWAERRTLPSPSPALRAPPGDPFGVGP